MPAAPLDVVRPSDEVAGRAGPAPDTSKVGSALLPLQRSSSNAESCEADSGGISGDTPLRTSGPFSMHPCIEGPQQSWHPRGTQSEATQASRPCAVPGMGGSSWRLQRPARPALRVAPGGGCSSSTCGRPGGPRRRSSLGRFPQRRLRAARRPILHPACGQGLASAWLR